MFPFHRRATSPTVKPGILVEARNKLIEEHNYHDSAATVLTQQIADLSDQLTEHQNAREAIGEALSVIDLQASSMKTLSASLEEEINPFIGGEFCNGTR